jgi:SAM-dependent methyltransferase
MSESYETRINQHYNRSGHYDSILEWLRTQGKDLDALTAADLSPADEFHGGGLASTQTLASLSTFTADTRVADLGGGVGGPARYLASTYGCRVDVADLASELCSVGERLNRLVYLEDLVRFTCASATDTGLETGAYDIIWMQNAAMNIEDRPALYSEIRRLLKPGGLYVFQEILAGDTGPAYYPSNWATTQAESLLRSPEDVLRLLFDAGFRAIRWEDQTSTMPQSRQATDAARLAGTAPPNYLSMEKLRESAVNVRRSTDEGRLRYGLGLFQKLGD